MLRRILVPLDGSPFAETALPMAQRLALRDAAELELVMVQESSGWFARAAAAPVREGKLDREVEFRSRVYLDDAAGKLTTGGGPPPTTALLAGRTVTLLLEHIQARDIDLVVMTTHARGGASRMWLGSVADGLVRKSAAPVLLLRPGVQDASLPEPPFARVLLPLDGAADGEAILGPATDVAGTAGVEYHLLRVLAADEPADLLPRRGETPASRSQRATVEAVLDRVAEALRARGAATRVLALPGEGPATGILSYAGQHTIDLIAMTSRSAGGLERWLLGSVADKVLRGTTRPLLLVNPRATPPEGRG